MVKKYLLALLITSAAILWSGGTASAEDLEFTNVDSLIQRVEYLETQVAYNEASDCGCNVNCGCDCCGGSNCCRNTHAKCNCRLHSPLLDGCGTSDRVSRAHQCGVAIRYNPMFVFRRFGNLRC